jgi:hypothetical protein
MAVIKNRGSQKRELPWYYVDDITVPLANFNSTQKYINGKEYKYADMFSVNTCSVKIYSDMTGLAFNYCDKWVKSVYRDDNLYQMPSEYKKDLWIFILDSTRKVVVSIQLLGVWPTAWADYQLVGNASAALETSLTLSVDDVKLNYSDDPDAIAASIRSVMGNLSSGNDVGGGSSGDSFGSQDVSGAAMQNFMQESPSTMLNNVPGANKLKNIVSGNGVTYALNNAANKAIGKALGSGVNNILTF